MAACWNARKRGALGTSLIFPGPQVRCGLAWEEGGGGSVPWIWTEGPKVHLGHFKLPGQVSLAVLVVSAPCGFRQFQHGWWFPAEDSGVCVCRVCLRVCDCVSVNGCVYVYRRVFVSVSVIV